MVRKSLLVAVTVWFGRDANYQILQIVCHPHEDRLIGLLESAALCASLFSLLLGNAPPYKFRCATPESGMAKLDTSVSAPRRAAHAWKLIASALEMSLATAASATTAVACLTLESHSQPSHHRHCRPALRADGRA